MNLAEPDLRIMDRHGFWLLFWWTDRSHDQLWRKVAADWVDQS